MTDIHETAEYLRRMGETEASVDYLTARIQPSLLDIFGEALRPALNPPATETGD
jgi:hypothetical protein